MTTIPVFSFLILGVPSCYIAGKLISGKVSHIKEKKHLTKVSDEICFIYDIEGYSYDKGKILNRVFEKEGFTYFDVIPNYTDIDRNDIKCFIIGSKSNGLISRDDNKRIIGNQIKIKLFNEKNAQLDEQVFKLEALLLLLDSESSIVKMNIEDFLSRNFDLQDLMKEIYYLKRRINILDCLSNIYHIQASLFFYIGDMMQDSNNLINKNESRLNSILSNYKSSINTKFTEVFKDRKNSYEEKVIIYNKGLDARNNNYKYAKQIEKYSAILARLEFIMNQLILEAEANRKFDIKTSGFICLEEIKKAKEEYDKKVEEELVSAELPFKKSLVLYGKFDPYGERIINPDGKFDL